MPGCSKAVGKPMTKEKYEKLRYQEYLELTQDRDVCLNVYIRDLNSKKTKNNGI